MINDKEATGSGGAGQEAG